MASATWSARSCTRTVGARSLGFESVMEAWLAGSPTPASAQEWSSRVGTCCQTLTSGKASSSIPSGPPYHRYGCCALYHCREHLSQLPCAMMVKSCRRSLGSCIRDPDILRQPGCSLQGPCVGFSFAGRLAGSWHDACLLAGLHQWRVCGWQRSLDGAPSEWRA